MKASLAEHGIHLARHSDHHHRRILRDATPPLPLGLFAASSAQFALTGIMFKFTRSADALAVVSHAKAATATFRRQLISVTGRLAESALRQSRTY